MANPLHRGALGQVSAWQPSSASVTRLPQQSIYAPHGLRLRQTITSSGSVTIPAGIEWVYAVLAGGGGSNLGTYGGCAGEVVWGWTLAQNTCVIGAGGTLGDNGGFSRYGHLLARCNQRSGGFTHFYGIPAGASQGDASSLPGGDGGNAGRGGGNATGQTIGPAGGSGISGGGGGQGNPASGSSTGGAGGSGLAGGGGGAAGASGANTRTGGAGGTAIGIDGTIYTGGTPATTTSGAATGGGGAGIAGNGSGTTGGLGGGGSGGSVASTTGGAGILYLFY